MSKFKTPVMQRRMTPNNVTNVVSNMKNEQVTDFLARQDRLTDFNIDFSAQPIVNPNIIIPASTATTAEPTDSGFTGLALSGDGWTFDGETWHFVGVNAGTLQAGINTEGKIKAGGGEVTLDEDGLTFANSDLGGSSQIKWYDGTTPLGRVYAAGSDSSMNIESSQPGEDSKIILFANGDGSGTEQIAQLTIRAGNDGGATEANLLFQSNGGEVAYFGADVNRINGTQNDVNTEVYGVSATPIATFDAGLNALGVGGAAESGKIAKFTGATHTTGASALDGLVTTLAGIDNTDGHCRSRIAIMADDSATSFTPTKSNGIILFGTTDNTAWGMAFYNAAGPSVVILTGGSNTNATTGALAGTTGTDTKFTVSAHATDGKVYFENRRGASRNLYITMF